MSTTKKKATVLKAYKDKNDGKIHLVGDEVSLTAARLKELSDKGFVAPKDKAPKKDAEKHEGE